MLKEIDVSLPIEKYLENLGYMVRSEVKGCDITAIKDEHFIVVECKKNISLKLIYQCVDRQEFCDNVYLAVPILNGKALPNRKYLLKLLKRLELGLITVTFFKTKTKVEIVLDPKEFKKKKKVKYRDAVIKEMNSRSGNYNRGGAVGTKLMTAYRESALDIAFMLKENEPMSAPELKKLGATPKAYDILYKNYYQWFYKASGRGKYGLSEKGKSALSELNKANNNGLN